MTYSEIVTAAMALVALLISAVAMYRAGVANKIAKDANELARSQDALAQLHLQQEQDRRNKTNLISVEPQPPVAGFAMVRVQRGRLFRRGVDHGDESGAVPTGAVDAGVS